ncbi:MAG: hypothetical protein SPJ13_06025, partial [Bacteroidales bacterium]|nr:hypothetical protein [Bacteroidales bacterium]
IISCESDSCMKKERKRSLGGLFLQIIWAVQSNAGATVCTAGDRDGNGENGGGIAVGSTVSLLRR